ncbi:hypothetical protein PAECIP111802_05723 [Paenibacillus allorhizosphaerae]|uniref:Uncharacterized protein n=1 Tax=Paenibacillus allorhizosphaerae TaxID=2849866 RepID=A0ABN7TVT6_9BACL|nr:hypothetical protein PAECIP111802_05723 [Paenibacillus allorhizosphaerae]
MALSSIMNVAGTGKIHLEVLLYSSRSIVKMFKL